MNRLTTITYPAGGPPFGTVLMFRVAARSWFFEGAEGLIVCFDCGRVARALNDFEVTGAQSSGLEGWGF